MEKLFIKVPSSVVIRERLMATLPFMTLPPTLVDALEYMIGGKKLQAGTVVTRLQRAVAIFPYLEPITLATLRILVHIIFEDEQMAILLKIITQRLDPPLRVRPQAQKAP